ncbi:MAG TPA: hypothetical protein VKP64_10360, partial [Mycobacteriales bacterium]|nr:hypothetical protein [Mycobacteriales bacterium]
PRSCTPGSSRTGCRPLCASSGAPRTAGGLSVPPLGWAKHVRLRLTGLAPGTRYEWRVVATTRAGTTVLGGRHVRTWGPRR